MGWLPFGLNSVGWILCGLYFAGWVPGGVSTQVWSQAYHIFKGQKGAVKNIAWNHPLIRFTELKPYLSHTEKFLISIALLTNKTGFLFDIRGKLSIIRCDKYLLSCKITEIWLLVLHYWKLLFLFSDIMIRIQILLLLIFCHKIFSNKKYPESKQNNFSCVGG